MMGLSRCNNTECSKKNECSRYTNNKSEAFVEFANICNQKNNYKWFDNK